MNVLDNILRRTRDRVRQAESLLPMSRLAAITFCHPNPFVFESALRKPGLSFICELKKASPSKGLLDAAFPYLEIASEYERGRAAALSVLTEPYYFLGDLRYLREIKEHTAIPILQKDFIIEEYQIVQARYFGADAVLLIRSLLDSETYRSLLKTANDWGMSVLTETRSEAEILDSLDAGAGIIGVNNRDLFTMKTDPQTCVRLRGLVPPDRLFVAESGFRTPEDINRCRKIGADAVLVGEALMSSTDKGALLSKMQKQSQGGK